MAVGLIFASLSSSSGIAAVGVVAALVGVVCLTFILADAFRRSVGTGVMTALIPFFFFYFAFAHFEHPRKGLILSGTLGGWGLAIVLALVSGGGLAAVMR